MIVNRRHKSYKLPAGREPCVILGNDYRVGLRMIKEKPMYWGSWKGRVIQAIAQHGLLKWDEILEITGLSSASLNTALSELYQLNQIERVGVKYRVCAELYAEYKDFLKTQVKHRESSVGKAKQHVPKRFSGNKKSETIEWINKWKDLEKLDFSTELGHFFLEGRHLDSISKGLISNAKTEVLVVNPFVASCDLSNTLREASKRGVEVMLVTRPPNIDKERYWKERTEYHSTLKKEGITLTYNRKAHAKLIVVDRAVAVISSMNFYSGSSAGSSWEAGMATVDERVVESVADSVLALVEKPESKKPQ